MTELTTYDYRPSSKFFVLTLAVVMLLCTTVALLLKPDAVQSALRCQYAASVQALVAQLTTAAVPSQDSELALSWKEQHQVLYDLFVDSQDDELLSSHFTALSSAYYRIDGLLNDLKEPGLTAAGRDYAREAERIFTWETARFNQAESRYFMLLVTVFFSGLVVILLAYRLLLVRSFGRMEETIGELGTSLRESDQQLAQTRKFVHQAISSFNDELRVITGQRSLSEINTDLQNRFTKLLRSSQSALAYTRELASEEPKTPAPLSLEGLLADVAEYIRTQTERNASDIAYTVSSTIRSVTAQADLIGPLLSQACVSILELRGVKGISMQAHAENVEDELVRVTFSFTPIADDVAGVNRTMDETFSRNGASGDFGLSLIDGLLRTINGKHYLDGTATRSLCIQLVAESYDDEVSADNNQTLEGKRVFVVDTEIDRLRLLVRQLSGYGVQATPFNSQQPILENLGALRKFDVGIIVNREASGIANELMDAIRKDREFEKLPIIGLYPDSDTPGAGIVWDALLTGHYTESEIVAALRFCLPSKSSASGNIDSTSSTQPTALQRARR